MYGGNLYRKPAKNIPKNTLAAHMPNGDMVVDEVSSPDVISSPLQVQSIVIADVTTQMPYTNGIKVV